MPTFSITDRSGATYMVDAPDEYAALRTLGQVTPHVGPALQSGATSPAAPASPATSGNYWDSAPLASDVAAARAAPAAPATRTLVPVDFDPFAAAAPQTSVAAPATPASNAPPAPRARTLLPVDYDPFAAPAAAPPPATRAGAFDDLMPPPPTQTAPSKAGYFDDLLPPAGSPAAAAPAPPQAPSWITRAMASIVTPVAGSLLGVNSRANPGVPTIEGTANDIARNVANGASLGFADKLAAGGDAMLGSGDYATNLAAQRAQSQAAMNRQGIAGNAEQIAGMLAPAGAIGKAVGGLGALADGVPFLGRMVGNPFVQAAATGAGVGAGDAAGHDTDLLRGALTGAASGVVGKGVADAATIPIGALASRFNAAPVIPSAADIAAQKTAAYAAADKAGVIVTPEAAQRLAGNIRATMAGHNYDPATEPQGGAILSTLSHFPTPAPATPQPSAFGYAGASGAGVGISASQPPMPQGVTLQGLDGLRQVVGKLYSGNPSEQALAAKIINGPGGIDSFVNGLQPSDLLSGDAPAGIAALNEARRLAQIGFKSDAVGTPAAGANPATGALGAALDNASVAHGNVYKSIGQQAKALKASGQPFTPDESAALQSIINVAPPQKALRFLGGLSPTSGGLMTGLEGVGTLGALDHAGALGAASAMAVPAIGYAAKKAADRAAVRDMTALGDLVRSGGNAAAIAPTQNVVQQAAQGANGPLSLGGMNTLLRLLGPGVTGSVAQAEPDSRAAALAKTLTQARQPPSGMGAVFAR